MKIPRWRSALLAASLALLSAVPAMASWYSPAPRWTDMPVRFINTQIPALADSDYATGDAARLDTTQAIPIFELYQPFTKRVGTAIDSTDWIQLNIIPDIGGSGAGSAAGAAPTVSADSVYLQTQVSIDGLTWVLVTPNITFQVANTVRPYGTGGFVLEANATNCFSRVYKTVWAGTGEHQTALVGTAPTDNQLWGYNFVRFIIGSANDGRYRAVLNHWTIKDLN